MSVTAASFKAKFSEFENADDTVVDAFISDAYATTPVETWDTLQDQGVEWAVAARLARTPNGRAMALSKDESRTNYDVELERLRLTVGFGVARLI